MQYVSTRGGDAPHDFESVVFAGLARDGGLFVPQSWPRFTPEQLKAMRVLPYTELAVRVMSPFVGDSLKPGELAALAQDTYAHFDHPEVTPLVPVDDQLQLLELFHGATLAFKDVALQFLGRVFGHFVHRRGGELTVIGATSGDTGSAAIEGCRGIPGVKVFILYPHERPSEVQRRQMTTVAGDNVHAIAVEGSFDDCQAMVKRAFNDAGLRARHRLTAVNSINWARILAQIVYYFYAGLRAGALENPVTFVVPTGNFGNVYAGYAARQMGLPVEKLVIATNRNDSLARFINTGVMQPGVSEASLSPSMDIQIASNAERYIFELLGRDAGKLNTLMAGVQQGRAQLSEKDIKEMQETFTAFSASDALTEETMRFYWEKHRILLDPHSAVGAYAAGRIKGKMKGKIVSLACAHPAKFPETVERVTGQKAALPPPLADLYQRKERFTVIGNDFAAFTRLIEG
jgi:threonine synthase